MRVFDVRTMYRPMRKYPLISERGEGYRGFFFQGASVPGQVHSIITKRDFDFSNIDLAPTQTVVMPAYNEAWT